MFWYNWICEVSHKRGGQDFKEAKRIIYTQPINLALYLHPYQELKNSSCDVLKVTNYRGVLEGLLPHPKSTFSTFLSYFQCFYEEQFNTISALEERLSRGVRLYPRLNPSVWWLASSNSYRTLSSLDLWRRPLWRTRTLVMRCCCNVATSNKSVCLWSLC